MGPEGLWIFLKGSRLSRPSSTKSLFYNVLSLEVKNPTKAKINQQPMLSVQQGLEKIPGYAPASALSYTSQQL